MSVVVILYICLVEHKSYKAMCCCFCKGIKIIRKRKAKNKTIEKYSLRQNLNETVPFSEVPNSQITVPYASNDVNVNANYLEPKQQTVYANVENQFKRWKVLPDNVMVAVPEHYINMDCGNAIPIDDVQEEEPKLLVEHKQGDKFKPEPKIHTTIFWTH